MNSMGWLQLAAFVGALLALTKPLGLYLERVLDPERQDLSRPSLRPG